MSEAEARGPVPRLAEPATDAAIIRRVRWRLLAWSGGSTLVVLIALGSLLYTAVDNSLATAATDQLRERARFLVETVMAGPAGIRSTDGSAITVTPAEPGILIGGPSSGTVAFVSTPGGMLMGGSRAANTLIDHEDLKAAQTTGRETVREKTIADGLPLRVLTVPVEGPGGTWVVGVVGDRTAEELTLGVVLTMLVAGGLVALFASLVVGWMYADRALVPIRESMRRQREFAADASHELRTPLAIVKGSIEHLRRNRDQPVAAVGDALDDLDAGTDRLTALVDDLLVLARTDSGAIDLDLATTDLGELVLDALGSLSSVADSHGVQLQIDAEPVPITADAGRLRQLVVILVGNAIRHSAAAGGRSVEVSVRGTAGRAILAVDDDGHGIRQEDLPRVFDRFWRAADAPTGGTGLGLAIARWIVERHGGTIVASNRAGGGARFEVSLPRLAAAPPVHP